MRLLRPLLVVLVSLAPLAPAAAQTHRPVIERIDPAAGPEGLEVEVVGRHLVGDAELRLGDVPLPVVRRSPTRWTVRIPEGARSGRVVVRSGAGEHRGPEFRVLPRPPAPVVTGVTPTRARPGAEVVLEGENFSARPGETTVTLAGVEAVVRRATPTRLDVLVPAGASTAPFVVAVRHAGEARSAEFTVEVPTAIASLDPAVGPVGSTVAVEGTGFSSNARDVRVLFGRRPARVASATPTRLVVEVPNGATTGPVTVDVRGAGRATSEAPFRVQPVPEIAGFTPGEAMAGRPVTIRGRHFGEDAAAVAVTLGEVGVPVREARGNELAITVPDGAATAPLAVRVHGVGPATSAAPLVVLAPLRLESVAPESGPPGTVLVVRGAGFSPTPAHNRVAIGDTPLEVVAASPGELSARVPEQATSGAVTVRVENGGTGRSVRPFLVTTPPVIAGVEPPQGLVGSEVVITGSSFGTQRSLVAVKLGERSMPVTSLADDRIVAEVPRGAVTAPITVSVRLQGTAATPTAFTVLQPFAVQRVEPARAHEGARVTMVGEGLVEGTTVAFPGVRRPVTPVRVTSEGLRVEVPARARTGEITVRVPDGRERRLPFEVAPTPSGVGIAGIEPPTCRRPGCAVTILGWGFGRGGRDASVAWGDAALEVTERSPTALTVTLPGTTGRHPFRVTVRGEEATSEPFVVVP